MSQERRAPISGALVAVLWAVTAVLAWAGIGTFLDELLTGIDSEERSKGLAIVAALFVVGSIAATVLWARSLGSERTPPPTGRRKFLTGLATTTGGVLASGAGTLIAIRGWITTTGPAIQPQTPLSDPSPREAWKGARIQSYRRLGRTNFDVSDISLGSGRIKGELGEQIAREAIERGINYFDTAPDYSEAGSELALGRAMKGHRDKMFVATKFCTPDGHLQVGAPVEKYVQVVEESLKRLQTDYVDLVHVHACDTVDRLADPNLHEAFQRLKQEGKARFLGFSSHTPHLEQVADFAIADGRFDVMMLAYHHGAWPRLAEIIKRAHEKDIGVVAMKTLKGAKHKGLLEMRPEVDSYTQAAFKWVLGNRDVSCLVISFFEPQQVDEYIYASGKILEQQDVAVLSKYDRLIAGTHCYPHCGDCLDSCPENLPIADVLRYRMYFEDYGDQKEAMRLYAKLEKNASLCLGCPGPCTNACTHDVRVRERMIGAHDLLRFA